MTPPEDPMTIPTQGEDLVLVPRELLTDALRDLTSFFPREVQVVAGLGMGDTSIERLAALLSAVPSIEGGEGDSSSCADRSSPQMANPDQSPSDSFQARVLPWMLECFGPVIPFDKIERADRFIEESVELAQTTPGFTRDRAHALVDYVFNRAVGEPSQEVGGVMVTLAAYCIANKLDMAEAGETELARIWTKVPQIRAKQAAKPTGSALPVAPSSEAPPGDHGPSCADSSGSQPQEAVKSDGPRGLVPLSEWMSRMAELAGYDSADAMIAETGACCWMHFYTDGYTPGEAWAEECSDG